MLLVFSEKNVLVESSVEQYDNEKYQSGAAPHTNVLIFITEVTVRYCRYSIYQIIIIWVTSVLRYIV